MNVNNKSGLSFGNTVEVVYLNGLSSLSSCEHEKLMSAVTDFIVNEKGHVLKVGGQSWLEFVYKVQPSPLGVAQSYVTLELPNPSTEPGHYRLIRAAFVNEITSRLAFHSANQRLNGFGRRDVKVIGRVAALRALLSSSGRHKDSGDQRRSV